MLHQCLSITGHTLRVVLVLCSGEFELVYFLQAHWLSSWETCSFFCEDLYFILCVKVVAHMHKFMPHVPLVSSGVRRSQGVLWSWSRSLGATTGVLRAGPHVLCKNNMACWMLTILSAVEASSQAAEIPLNAIFDFTELFIQQWQMDSVKSPHYEMNEYIMDIKRD